MRSACGAFLCRVALLLAGPLVPVACTASAHDPADLRRNDLDPALFAASSEVLSGFDSAAEALPRAGDRVLLGIVARHGTVTEVRFLEVTLLADERDEAVEGAAWGQVAGDARGAGDAGEHGPRPASTLPATVTMRDENAGILSRRLRVVPVGGASAGLFASALVLHQHEAAVGDAGPVEALSFSESLRVAAGISSLVQVVMALADTELLLPLFWRTIQHPPPLSWFGHVELDVAIRGGERIGEVTARLGGGRWRAFRVPLSLSLRRVRLLDFDVLAVPPEPPLALCGGVVAIDARHPARPDVSVHIRLLAARRGGR
jgi:hypothetical protein